MADNAKGIGPKGAVPFSVPTIYFYEGPYQYRFDTKLNAQLVEKNLKTIQEAAEAIAAMNL